MRLTNHHSSAALAIEERPGRYLGYFENKFGEQLVFVHDDGEPDAMVLLGDVDWEPRRVSDAGGLPDAGDLIFNEEERAFVNACWIATAWRREDRSVWPVGGIVRHDWSGVAGRELRTVAARGRRAGIGPGGARWGGGSRFRLL